MVVGLPSKVGKKGSGEREKDSLFEGFTCFQGALKA